MLVLVLLLLGVMSATSTTSGSAPHPRLTGSVRAAHSSSPSTALLGEGSYHSSNTSTAFGHLARGPSLGQAGRAGTTLASPVGKVLKTVDVGDMPAGLVCDNANGFVYVANYGSDNVTAINGTTNTVVGSIPVGASPSALAFDSASGNLYVANLNSSNVSVIDPATDTVVGSIPVGAAPDALAYDNADGVLYVADFHSNNLTEVDGATDSVVGSIPVGSYPAAVSYDTANGDLYVANEGSFNVTVINGTTQAVVRSIRFGSLSFPDAVAVDSANGHIYVALSGYFEIAEVNGSTNAVDWYISVGATPDAITSNPTNGHIYVANWDSNNATVINGTTDVVVGAIQLGSEPSGLAYDGANGYIYATNYGSGSVSILTPPPYSLYSVEFVESGLPTGTMWYANVTLIASEHSIVQEPSLNSTSNMVTTALPNGSYFYNVSSADKRFIGPIGFFGVNGTFPGAVVTVWITFSPVTYVVTLTAAGIPTGVLALGGWTAEVDGVVEHSTSNSILFDEQNGTHEYLVIGPSGYPLSSPSASGTISVRGKAVEQTFSFSKGRTLTLTFREEGLPKGGPNVQRWCVELGGAWNLTSVGGWRMCSTRPFEQFRNLTPGNYSYAVVSPLAGQFITARLGTVAISSTGTMDLTTSSTVRLTFAYRYTVTFTATGLTAGTWSITVRGHTLTALWNQTVQFNLTNGTYGVKVGTEVGYKTLKAPPKITVNGAAVPVTVTFAKKSQRGG
jgi:YVTN family beta-propeller protein